MKVLLTGANGFVGSHILDRLRAQGVAVALLLRATSNTRFIEAHLPRVQVHYGSLSDRDSIRRAARDATHVIHCAGKTKVLCPGELTEANRLGTRNLVEGACAPGTGVRRLLHVSSLAASHPATPDAPAREDDPQAPISLYGRSKLEGEIEVREHCACEFTILRPPAVYGPRDADFLTAFRAVRHHVIPLVRGGRQPLSLIYAEDLAEAAVQCLTSPAAAGRTYNVASPEVATAGEVLRQAARALHAWAVPAPVPVPLLRLLATVQEGLSRLSGRANILNRDKVRELSAPGWVCDTSRLRNEVGFVARTPLAEGLAVTMDWYRTAGWL
jgi:nucleoside-diphosphate-sugar epimerase